MGGHPPPLPSCHRTPLSSPTLPLELAEGRPPPPEGGRESAVEERIRKEEKG
jgi:hypothetical protein